MRIFLVWTLFPGGWAVTGPARVTAKQGGSLAVSCSYKPGYKLYPNCFNHNPGQHRELVGHQPPVPHGLWGASSGVSQGLGSGQAPNSILQPKRSFPLHASPATGPPWLQLPQGASQGQVGWLADMQVPQSPSSFPRPYSSSSIISFLLPRSQLGITHLLLFLSVKVPVVLALVCRAAWVRSRHRSHDRENLQLLEVAGSTGAPGSPRAPEPQGQPPAPLPPTLPGLHHP
ncbi:uncharacterized protein LOC129214641 isoform X2 [Grus americana]|uniref:uncharacterized protein LOC129214641 isoform X2 n=1 Tax=Grus americana TaxID=9117 RepID=UPI002407B81B|nr:uncharacterized protein LOC129214641 isoform X2 [Grus americana]